MADELNNEIDPFLDETPPAETVAGDAAPPLAPAAVAPPAEPDYKAESERYKNEHEQAQARIAELEEYAREQTEMRLRTEGMVTASQRPKEEPRDERPEQPADPQKELNDKVVNSYNWIRQHVAPFTPPTTPEFKKQIVEALLGDKPEDAVDMIEQSVAMKFMAMLAANNVYTRAFVEAHTPKVAEERMTAQRDREWVTSTVNAEFGRMFKDMVPEVLKHYETLGAVARSRFVTNANLIADEVARQLTGNEQMNRTQLITLAKQNGRQDTIDSYLQQVGEAVRIEYAVQKSAAVAAPAVPAAPRGRAPANGVTPSGRSPVQSLPTAGEIDEDPIGTMQREEAAYGR